MRKVCKIVAFSPEEIRKSGDSEQREFKVRKVVIDASRFNEDTGETITEKYVADTFKPFTDEQLQSWIQSGEKVACYITFDADNYEGQWYQRVKLHNINEL